MHLSNTRQLPSTRRSVIPRYSAAKTLKSANCAKNHHFSCVHEQNAVLAFRTGRKAIVCLGDNALWEQRSCCVRREYSEVQERTVILESSLRPAPARDARPYRSHATRRHGARPTTKTKRNQEREESGRPSNQKQEERGRSPGKHKRRFASIAADIAAIRFLVVSCVGIWGAYAPGPCLDVRRLRCGAGSLACRQPSDKYGSLTSHRLASGTQRETSKRLDLDLQVQLALPTPVQNYCFVATNFTRPAVVLNRAGW